MSQSSNKMAIVAAAALMVLTACNDSTGPEGTARIDVHLTDAPADYLSIAEVCLSEVYLQGGEEDTAPRTVLWEKDDDGDGAAQCFDLLALQGISVTVTDGEVEIPAGTYEQLRFIVESARVVLAEGYTFSDGVSTERDLFIPSGAQTGIKVILLEPVVAETETATELTVDADVNDNFVIQGNPETPAGIQGVIFTPVLHEIDRDTEGE